MNKEEKCRNSKYSTSSPASEGSASDLNVQASLKHWLFARLTNFADWFCIGAGLVFGLKVMFVILGAP